MWQIGTFSEVILIRYLFVACTSKGLFLFLRRGRLQSAPCFWIALFLLLHLIVFAASAATAKFMPLDKKWDALPEPRDLVFQ